MDSKSAAAEDRVVVDARSLVLLGLTVALAAACPPTTVAAPSFSAEFVTSNIPPTAGSFALKDLDGDAIPDLLLPAPYSNAVAFLHGNGDGTFHEAALIPVAAEGPIGLALGDLDGDGHDDLMLVHQRSPRSYYYLSVMLGTGDGTFQPGKLYPGYSSGGSCALAAGDLNADGRLDLVTAANNGFGVSTFLGDGSGALRWIAAFASDATPTGVALADFDRDGTLDAAVSNAGSLRVSVLRGKGDGKFWPRTDFEVGNGQEAVAAGDLNGDGLADIVTTGVNAHSVAVLLGNGDGTFRDRADYPTGRYAWYVTIADLNADGHPDLAVAHEPFHPGEGSVSVLVGNGDGTFRASIEYGSGGGQAVTSADLDRDGHLDLVVIGGRTVSGLQGNGDGTFGLAVETGTEPAAIAAADLDGDGRADLVSVNQASGTVTVLLRRDGSFSRSNFPAGESPRGVALADLNADGALDLAVATTYDGTVAVLLGAGDGTFGAPTSYGAFGASRIVAADLNSDGRIDLAATAAGERFVAVLLGAGDGTFGTETGFAVEFVPTGLTARDVNSDGRPDLIVCNTGYPDLPQPPYDIPVGSTISVLLGNGDGTFEPQRSYATGSLPSEVAAQDLNGDGKIDLAVANWEGTVSILPGKADGTFGAATQIEVGYGAGSIGIADFDGDRIADLAVTSYYARAVMVLAGQGDGTFEPPVAFGTKQGPFALVVAGLDENPMPDLATANWNDESVSLLLNRIRPTPIAVTDLEARCSGGVLALRWRLQATPSEVGGIAVQRAETAAGPYVTRTPSALRPEAVMLFRDGDVEMGRVYWYRLVLTSRNGSVQVAGPVRVEPCGAPGAWIALRSATLRSGGTIEIRYGIGSAAAALRLTVYDAAGRFVRQLVRAPAGPGEHSCTWDGRNAAGSRVARGVYFVRLEADRLQTARKLLQVSH